MTCPWRCYEDEFINEIRIVFGDIGGYSKYGADLVGFLQTDPPQRLYEGLRYFRTAMSRMIAQRLEEERRKQERLARTRGLR